MWPSERPTGSSNNTTTKRKEKITRNDVCSWPFARYVVTVKQCYHCRTKQIISTRRYISNTKNKSRRIISTAKLADNKVYIGKNLFERLFINGIQTYHQVEKQYKRSIDVTFWQTTPLETIHYRVRSMMIHSLHYSEFVKLTWTYIIKSIIVTEIIFILQ